MKTKNLEVSAIVMVCIGFTQSYGEDFSKSDGIKVHKFFEHDCNLFILAEMYSYFKNKEFVDKALKYLPLIQFCQQIFEWTFATLSFRNFCALFKCFRNTFIYS